MLLGNRNSSETSDAIQEYAFPKRVPGGVHYDRVVVSRVHKNLK